MSKSQQSSKPKYHFPAPKPDPKPTWRIQLNQTQLVSQTCSILLQRQTKLWNPLLIKSLKLSTNFTPSLFHQILNKIQTHPQICLSFFKWAKKNLAFEPGLKTQCGLTRILAGSGQEMDKDCNFLLNSIIKEFHVKKIVPLLVQSSKDCSFSNVSPVLDSVVECYCRNDMFLECFEVFRMAKGYRVGLSVNCYNALLRLLGDKNEFRLVWCFYGYMIRNGVLGNEVTSLEIAKVLCREGQFARVLRVLDVEMFSCGMFELMIGCYSKRGDFEDAFVYVGKMCGKGFEPGFGTYSSILDGACRHRNEEVVEKVMGVMDRKGLLSESLDLIIHRLCGLVKIYAVDLFYRKACDEKVELLHSTYESVLSALLSEEGRLMDAIELFSVMQENGVVVKEACYDKFVTALCNENPSEQVSKLLVGILKGGFSSAATEVSKYVRRLCVKGLWREAGELLNLIMDQGHLLDPLSYGYFVRRYCSRRQIDSAVLLHDKLVDSKATLDEGTYNVFLAALFKEKRVEEAVKVFDYIKEYKVVTGESFSLMIRSLCHEKEMRKAMKLHDEMLVLGLKPDPRSYKRLISGFK